MSKYFSVHYDSIKFKKVSKSELGLRNSQMGAIFSIGSYFSINVHKTALVVMPTGSGKTGVLMLAPYILNATKVLIVTPSVMVREQIVNEFSTLSTLKKIGVFSSNIKAPRVFELKTKYSEDMKSKIMKSDVVVATPICAKSLSGDKYFKKVIDLVLIDEAHHVPARTWTDILCDLICANKILFTATPFRLDKKVIDGEMIYSYPLSLAFSDGIFGKIEYIPVAPDPTIESDILLAKKVEEVFDNDIRDDFEHLIMVRADTREYAKKLEQIYINNTSLKLIRIDSSMSLKYSQEVISKLRSKEIDGIICVDMLGEGFDFPNLKIAAIHSPHKSLSPTLQFIGRFTRTNADKLDKAKFIAIENEDLIIEKRSLFSSDAVWQDIVIDLSESRIQSDVESKDFIKNFTSINEDAYIIGLSLYDIKPNAHAKVFEVTDFDIFARFPSECRVKELHFVNEQNEMIVGVGKNFVQPKWSCTDKIPDIEHGLYVVHYQEETKLLFIYSSNKNEKLYSQIAESFCGTVKKIPRYKMNRVLADMEKFEIFNSGLQSRYADSGETYRILTGSNVANNIDASTGKMFSAGHVFCKAEKEKNGITIGYSSAGKIWSSSLLPLLDYAKWCDSNGLKISNSSISVITNTNLDFIPQSKELDKYPTNIFMADYYGDTYVDPPCIIIKENMQQIPLIDFDLCVKSVTSEEVIVQISYNDVECEISCNRFGNYKAVNNKLCLNVNQGMELSEYFNIFPLVFRTVDDVTIIGNDLLEGTNITNEFDIKLIYDMDWVNLNADVFVEYSSNPLPTGKKSIHEVILEILMDIDEYKYICYDHSSGEMADYIAIKEQDNSLLISLFHVKKKSSSNFNSNVGDLYEVCGQAIKSSIWLKSKKVFIRKANDRKNIGRFEMKKGDFKDLLDDFKKDIRIRAEIFIVQPSLTTELDLPDKIQSVLAATNAYLNNIGYVEKFLVWGSKK